MGKIFRYDKTTVSIVIFLILTLLTTVHSYASYREYDLLRKGYESYLSYQPEKAAEEFRTFLQEFPNSSARDAALFWLGKSLMQAKSTDEAGRVFIDLKRQFPDSPFIAFIVTQSQFPESEKLTTIRETEPVSQLGTSKDSADIRQPEPVRQTDEAITAPTTMMTDTAPTSETPADKEPEAAQSSIAIQQQMSETLSPVRSETIDVENVRDREPILSESETTPADGMMAKGEDPEATEPEVIKTESNETESKEPALQNSEVIESAAELPPDVALPGIVSLDASPEPKNIKAPDTVAITTAVEQETVSPQSEVSSEQTADIMKNVEEREEKESEVKEPVVKEPVVQEPEVKDVEVKDVEVQGPEVREPRVKEPAPLKEDQATREETGKQAVEEKKELPLTTEEQVTSESNGVALHKEETPVLGDTVRQDDQQVKKGELSPQATSESNTMIPAQTALNKVGIQGAIVWSTGDRNQDFIDEQILYNESVKLNLSVDEDELNGLRERYTLGIEEVDYLKRFLLICKLIDKKAKEIPGDKIVEVISVRYKDAGQREQPELAAELQTLANKGVTFEEISRSYPDIVQFKTIALQELPDWIQERIQGLQNYEVGVIWSEEGYMILKPIIQLYSYDPFEELTSEEREKLTAYIRSWIAELKGATPR